MIKKLYKGLILLGIFAISVYGKESNRFKSILLQLPNGPEISSVLQTYGTDYFPFFGPDSLRIDIDSNGNTWLHYPADTKSKYIYLDNSMGYGYYLKKSVKLSLPQPDSILWILPPIQRQRKYIGFDIPNEDAKRLYRDAIRIKSGDTLTGYKLADRIHKTIKPKISYLENEINNSGKYEINIKYDSLVSQYFENPGKPKPLFPAASSYFISVPRKLSLRKNTLYKIDFSDDYFRIPKQKFTGIKFPYNISAIPKIDTFQIRSTSNYINRVPVGLKLMLSDSSNSLRILDTTVVNSKLVLLQEFYPYHLKLRDRWTDYFEFDKDDDFLVTNANSMPSENLKIGMFAKSYTDTFKFEFSDLANFNSDLELQSNIEGIQDSAITFTINFKGDLKKIDRIEKNLPVPIYKNLTPILRFRKPNNLNIKGTDPFSRNYFLELDRHSDKTHEVKFDKIDTARVILIAATTGWIGRDAIYQSLDSLLTNVTNTPTLVCLANGNVRPTTKIFRSKEQDEVQHFLNELSFIELSSFIDFEDNTNYVLNYWENSEYGDWYGKAFKLYIVLPPLLTNSSYFLKDNSFNDLLRKHNISNNSQVQFIVQNSNQDRLKEWHTRIVTKGNTINFK